MPRPSRRVMIGVVAGLCVVLLAAGLWVGLSVKRAADDVSVMMVPAVELPTDAPTPQPGASDRATTQPEGVEPTPAVETPEPTAVPAPDDPVNILLMGTDARPGDTEFRTDAMIVVRLDPKTDRVSMLSLPRDLWVNMPKVGAGRINTAYMLGEKKIGPGYGPALAKKTVGNLLGIPIQHFVLINFDGFQTLIDKLGGITIDVPKAIDDPKYPLNEFPGDYRSIKIHFDPGVQVMDGTRALQYARTRHQDSDFGRHQRQQQVLMAIFQRVREKGMLNQLTSLDDYTAALRDYVRLDMSRDDMLSLASVAPHVSPQSIEHYQVSPAMLREQANPYYLFLVDKKGFKNLVAQFLEGQVTASTGESAK